MRLRQFVLDVICRMSPPDHFERLGVPRRFVLDQDDIDKQYLARSRALHPDFHQLGASSERQASMELTAQLNEAYATLKDPFRRAEYLLQLEGGPPPGSSSQIPPEFLEEVLEWRLRWAEAADDSERARLERQLRERQDEMMRNISEDFSELERGAQRDATLQRLRQRLDALKYIQNLLRRR